MVRQQYHEYMIPGHVAEQVINDIAAWIKGIIP